MAKAELSELEGAVLIEIGHRGNDTSFKVRRAFERSPSSSWSGSAGAVYPAIARLERAGLIEATPSGGGRGTRWLRISVAGKRALEQWAADAEAACGIGADPFRGRAGVWMTLRPERRHALLTEMMAAVEEEAAKLTGRDDLDPVEGVGNDLALMQQEMRLTWLRAALAKE